MSEFHGELSIGDSSPKLFQQVLDERLNVDFDTYDTSLADLHRRFSRNRIDIAPDYQRHFVWDRERQSKLIESLLLGIPVPDLYMAYDLEKGGAWEVVDGVQRLTSIIGYIEPSNPNFTDAVREKLTVKLTGLKTLYHLNGKSYNDLDNLTRDFLDDRFLKIVLLNDKSSRSVKYELFERLNTGGIRLEDQEIRNVVYRGPFTELLHDVAAHPEFSSVVKPTDLTVSKKEELALKFFAYRDRFNQFDHSVKEFLQDYTRDMTEKFEHNTEVRDQYAEDFRRTFVQLSQLFPNGIVRNGRQQTPVNLFEAVSVAASIAMNLEYALVIGGVEVLDDEALTRFSTGATNSKSMVYGRISRAFELMTGHSVDLREIGEPSEGSA